MGSNLSRTFSPRKRKRRSSYYARGYYETKAHSNSYYKKKYIFDNNKVKFKIYKNGRVI